MKELWKTIPGWEKFYQVSNLGRVRSLIRTIENRKYPSVILKPTLTKKGYFQVYLSRYGKKKNERVHGLVLRSFRGVRPSGYDCRHLNGNRSDNRLSNIKYGTKSENAQDRHAHGTMNQGSGENSSHHKLSNKKVRWIRNNCGKVSFRKMALKLNVARRTISLVANNITWRSVK